MYTIVHTTAHTAKQRAAGSLARLRTWTTHQIAPTGYRFSRMQDAVVVLLLLMIALVLTKPYLRGDLFVWGDHPGQFMRFWYPLTHGIPQSGRTIWGVLSWNPTWYAGYPELQFYPPGTTLLGILLYYLTLGMLAPEQIYNLIIALAFSLPLFTCYIFLRTTLAPLGQLPSMLAGVTAAFLAISLKPMWGGVDSVMIGLMGERLAFGFVPLVLLAGWRLVEQPHPRHLVVAAVALACLLLLHPFHAPAVVVAVLFYALVRQEWRRDTALSQSSPQPSPHSSPQPSRLWRKIATHMAWIVGWNLLAVGLVAWWLLPLITHYTPYAAALVRATPEQVPTWFTAGSIERLCLAAPFALLLLTHRHPRIEGTVIALATLVPLLVGGILFNIWVLVARFNFTLLDPIRFIAEYYLALILLVGAAVGAVTARFLWRISWLASLVALSLLVVLFSYFTEAWDNLRVHAKANPAWWLEDMRGRDEFEGYWNALRNDPNSGRVLVVANYLFLEEEDGTTTPTTIHSMTPYLTGREIVGGTFSHWSPVSRWLWVNDPHAKRLPARVEQNGSTTIFGRPWQEIDPHELRTNLRRLNVTTIVASIHDQDARAMLESLPDVPPYWHNQHFTIYHLDSADGEWFAAGNATAALVERTARRWRFTIEASAPDAKLMLKMSHYPLWRARIHDQTIQVNATPEGLQEIDLPVGGPYTLEVFYREGWPEWTGLLLSLSTLLLSGLLLITPRLSRTRENQAS